jgi:hypothetical protein
MHSRGGASATNDITMLPAETEADLVRRYQAGDKRAGEILHYHFRPLRIRLAKPFFRIAERSVRKEENRWVRCTFEDNRDSVLAVVDLAFFEALRTFDPSRGNRFPAAPSRCRLATLKS